MCTLLTSFRCVTTLARSLGLWEEGSVSLSGDELDSTDPLQLTDRILHVRCDTMQHNATVY